jgi:predicted permease
MVSANYFSLLGVPALLGRGFQPEEERSPSPSAVLTHAFWEKLGGDPAIIGSTLKLSRGFATIVGVMPPGFTGDRLAAPAFFLTLGAEETLNSPTLVLSDRGQRNFSITGRLRKGLDLNQARGALSVLNARFPQADPFETRERQLTVAPADRFDYHPLPEALERQALPFGFLAQGMTLLVLFIVCLNLANMVLARGAARQKEIAIRLSLGAARRRILRQLLTEGLLLASLGAAAGLMVSIWTASLLGTIVAAKMGVELTSRGGLMDWRLFGALSAFSLLATLFFALGPALRLSRLDFNIHVKGAHASDSMNGGKALLRIKNLVAVAQIALVMTLLIAAALLTRSALNAVAANPGFEIGSNLVVRLDERASGDSEPEALALVREAIDRIAALPGVESVSPALLVPLGPATSGRIVWPGAVPPAPDDRFHSVLYNKVGLNYFKTLGAPLLRGREFNRIEVESTNAPPSVIISQKLADQLWPGTDPVGKTLQLSGAPGTGWQGATVIGVAPDVKWNILDRQPPGELYEAPAGRFSGAWNLHIRLRPGVLARDIMAACSAELRIFENRIPIPQIQTLKGMQRRSPQVLLMEIGAGLFGVFGLVAEFLSFLGIYGLKAFEVSRRTGEIGIRMALGAKISDVLRLILCESARMAGCGLGMGLLLSLAMGGLASRFLYGVSRFDPLIFSVVPLLVMAVVLVACLIPARRAAGMNPMQALRNE